MIPGEYTPTGPQCMLKLVDGPREGRCLDVESERVQPGGKVHVYPCVTRWHQLFSFGGKEKDGGGGEEGSSEGDVVAPLGSVHASLPRHVVKTLGDKGKMQEKGLCLGVKGRGSMDESEWEEDGDEKEEEDGFPLEDTYEENAGSSSSGTKPLRLWKGAQLRTTPCSNVDGVVEFFYVPFIVEEESHDSTQVNGNKNDASGDMAGAAPVAVPAVEISDGGDAESTKINNEGRVLGVDPIVEEL